MEALKKKLKDFIRDNILKNHEGINFEERKNFVDKKTLSKFIDFFNNEKIRVTLSDVGARRGLLYPLDKLNKLNKLKVERFEPNSEDFEKLKKSGMEVLGLAVYDKEGENDFYLTNAIGGSSLIKPKEKILKKYSKAWMFEVKDKIKVRTTTLDKHFSNKKIDFIKMDTQGTEYEILMGGRNKIKKTSGIVFESHFFEIYENQKLFPELHNLMLKNNFRLLRLNLRLMDGELFESGDCVYIKDPDKIKTKEEFLKIMLFALVWDRKEYAKLMIKEWGNKFLSRKELIKVRNILGK